MTQPLNSLAPETLPPDDLIALLFELQSQVLGQQDLLERLQAETTALKAEIAAAQAQERHSQHLLQESEAALAAAQSACAEAQRQSLEVEGELSRIHASKAWRITAPLRRLRAGFSGRT